MAYQSRYYGTEIDKAVGAVLQKETTWDGKQAKLTGTQGQVVGFDAMGNAVAQGTGSLVGPAGPTGPAGPAGAPGTPGADATINGVNALEIEAGQNISLSQEGNTLTISATGGEGGGGGVTPENVVTLEGGGEVVLSGDFGTAPFTIKFDEEEGGDSGGVGGASSASEVSYDNTASGVEATNVQAAIDELFEKASEGTGGGITEIPIASSTVLGGVKVGSGLSITSSGILSGVTMAQVQSAINSAIEETRLGSYNAKITATYDSGFSTYFDFTLDGAIALTGTMNFKRPIVKYRVTSISSVSHASPYPTLEVYLGENLVKKASYISIPQESTVATGDIDITGYSSTPLAIKCTYTYQ